MDKRGQVPVVSAYIYIYTQGIQRVVTKMINRQWEPFVKFNLPSEQIASDVSSSSTT